jgi:branched-chain amino acid transport system ATP-binding protein/nonpolar-amino-acid-transporting ATPase
VLRVENLEAGYGGLPVLHAVTLGVDRNESVAIIGPNGAGKSTLVRAICGLLPVAAGRVLHDGVPVSDVPAHERTRHGIAVVLENRHLFGELTVRNNLELAAVHGKRRLPAGRGEARRRFSLEEVIELFSFMRGRLDAPVALLSGGEQQMVAIARALLLHPDLLIMDEPSTGLSPKVVRDIVGVMARLREGGMSLLLVEQNVALAAEVSDRAYVMALGRVVHEIKPGEWDGFRNNDALLRAYLGGERTANSQD